jgi:hypothetical protein
MKTKGMPAKMQQNLQHNAAKFAKNAAKFAAFAAEK